MHKGQSVAQSCGQEDSLEAQVYMRQLVFYFRLHLYLQAQFIVQENFISPQKPRKMGLLDWPEELLTVCDIWPVLHGKRIKVFQLCLTRNSNTVLLHKVERYAADIAQSEDNYESRPSKLKGFVV